MKLETLLNAYGRARVYMSHVGLEGKKFPTYLRQHQAFRARILKMDEEKDVLIERYRTAAEELAPIDQKWFWTKEWQEKELEAERDIAADRIEKFDSAEEFINSLREKREDNDGSIST